MSNVPQLQADRKRLEQTIPITLEPSLSAAPSTGILRVNEHIRQLEVVSAKSATLIVDHALTRAAA